MAEVLTLHGDLEMWSRLKPLTAGGAEFVNVSHDLDTWPGAREAARRRTREGADGEARKLFSPAVLTDERDRRLLADLAADGAEVRITTAPLPQSTFFVGARTMILTEPDGRGGRRYTMSTAPALVAGSYALFEAAWAAAADLDAFLRSDRPLLDARAKAVLAALGSGATDEAAARRLGVSLRTYRRRVAGLLAALGADSRFQAGVRAGALGLDRD
ncbi:DNA-binding response regulator [Glycomyces sp. NPDC048151]|uniref:helix-turn-helix transcriptional regulator n=1 Tax=Glycomyces sp. NPDC048151 TaxID=3364002 RepID=UPI0037232E2A